MSQSLKVHLQGQQTIGQPLCRTKGRGLVTTNVPEVTCSHCKKRLLAGTVRPLFPEGPTNPYESLYRVLLTEVGLSIIPVIRSVRDVCRPEAEVGLREAKEIVEAVKFNGTPCPLISDVTWLRGLHIQRTLQQVDAKIVLQDGNGVWCTPDTVTNLREYVVRTLSEMVIRLCGTQVDDLSVDDVILAVKDDVLHHLEGEGIEL